jgi:3,4-dihydroxy 2-butanone 4-phosphate synthase/GTP cyclohydrolase II
MADAQPEVHWAIVKGKLSSKLPVLTRVHRAEPLEDLLGQMAPGGPLQKAFEAITKEGQGVLLYLQVPQAPRVLGQPGAGKEVRPEGLRELGLGAQILRSLGIRRLHLLSHGVKRMVGLESYGLEIVRYSNLGGAGRQPLGEAKKPLGGAKKKSPPPAKKPKKPKKPSKSGLARPKP